MFEEIKTKLRKFNEERTWTEYHNPKELAIALSIEASELLECFLWGDNITYWNNENIRHEIADVLIYAIILADRLDIDIEKAILEKMEINKKKYPVKRSLQSE